MEYKVIQSKKFNDAFDGVFTYIKATLKSPKAAENLRKETIKSAINLQTIPEAYPKLDGIMVENLPVRFLTIKNFCILFTIDGDRVLMHNFVYSKSEKCRSNNK